MEVITLLFGDVAAAVAQPVFPRTPAGVHPIRRTLHDGLDLMDLALPKFEQLHDLPGPGLLRTRGYLAAVRRFEVPRIAGGVIEEAKSENQTALGIDGHVPSVAN